MHSDLAALKIEAGLQPSPIWASSKLDTCNICHAPGSKGKSWHRAKTQNLLTLAFVHTPGACSFSRLSCSLTGMVLRSPVCCGAEVMGAFSSWNTWNPGPVCCCGAEWDDARGRAWPAARQPKQHCWGEDFVMLRLLQPNCPVRDWSL